MAFDIVAKAVSSVPGMGQLDTMASAWGHEDAYSYLNWLGVDASDGITSQVYADNFLHRCACKDILTAEEANREAASQWPESCQTEVTTAYDFRSLPGVSEDIIEKAWLAALDFWNKVCGINMTLVRDPSDVAKAKIIAAAGPLPGGTLAWSYLPNNTCSDRLRQMYDTTQRWTFDFIAKTIAHEHGHAIGLGHSNQRADIMYPSIQSPSFGSYPSQNDIARVVQRYGPPKEVPNDPVDPKPDDPVIEVIGEVRFFTGEHYNITRKAEGTGTITGDLV